MFKQSKKLDVNKPYTMVLYNPAFGDSYVVEPTSFDVSMNAESSNMIHQYAMTMVAVAPLTSVLSTSDIDKSTSKVLVSDMVSKLATASLKTLQQFIVEDTKTLSKIDFVKNIL